MVQSGMLATRQSLAHFWIDGLTYVGVQCRRCGSAARLAIAGELRRHWAKPLDKVRQCLHCAHCARRPENPERHNDLILKPLRPDEPWP
jgi:hypothetical protein